MSRSTNSLCKYCRSSIADLVSVSEGDAELLTAPTRGLIADIMEKQLSGKIIEFDFINNSICKNKPKPSMNNSSSQPFHTTATAFLKKPSCDSGQIEEFSVSPKKSKNSSSDDCTDISSSLLVGNKDPHIQNAFLKDVFSNNDSKLIVGINKDNNNTILNVKSDITSSVENKTSSSVPNSLSLDLLHELVPEVDKKINSVTEVRNGNACELPCNTISDIRPKNVPPFKVKDTVKNSAPANQEKHDFYVENELDDILKCPQFIRTEKKHYSNDAVNLDELDMSLSKILNSAKTDLKDCISQNVSPLPDSLISKESNSKGDHTYHLPFPSVRTSDVVVEAIKLDGYPDASQIENSRVVDDSVSECLSIDTNLEGSDRLRTSTANVRVVTSIASENKINAISINRTNEEKGNKSAVSELDPTSITSKDAPLVSNSSLVSDDSSSVEVKDNFNPPKDAPEMSNLSMVSKDLSLLEVIDKFNPSKAAPKKSSQSSVSEDSISIEVGKEMNLSKDASKMSNLSLVSKDLSSLESKEELDPSKDDSLNEETSPEKEMDLASKIENMQALAMENKDVVRKGEKVSEFSSATSDHSQTPMDVDPPENLKDTKCIEASVEGVCLKEAIKSTSEINSDVLKSVNIVTETTSDDKSTVEKLKTSAPCFAKLSPTPDTDYECNECGAKMKTQNSLFTHKKMHRSTIAVTGLVTKRRLQETEVENANVQAVKPKRGRPRLNKNDGSKSIATTLKENIPKKVLRTRAQATEKPQMKSKEIAKAVKEGKTGIKDNALKICKNPRLRESVLTNKNKTKTTSKSESLGSTDKNVSIVEAVKSEGRTKSYTPSSNLMRKFACSECGAKFKRNDHLKRHQLLHSEKGFQCTQCNMKFYRADKLKLHTFRHHNNVSAKTVTRRLVVPTALKVTKLPKLPKRSVECQKCGFQYLRIIPHKTDKSGLSRRKNSCCISCGAKFQEEDNY